ncbi:MAG: hypothetical protein OQK24_02240 [Magnetovibrio sp.]|nr:hypothetical protein [Magnetovibrio sp.]
MSPTPFEAHLEVTKTIIGMVLTIGIAIIGLVFAWTKRGKAIEAGWTSDVVGPMMIGIALFFVMATMAFKQYQVIELSKRGPIVRIDAQGIFDHRVGPNPIPWSAISGAEIKDISNAKMMIRDDDDKREHETMGVVLSVENASQYFEGDGVLAATGKALGEATGHNLINISPEGINTTAEGLIAAIQAHRPAE